MDSLYMGQKSLFMHCLLNSTVHVLKNIKNGSHGTIHTFKNYFVIVISVFSFNFSNNKFNSNGIKMIKEIVRGKFRARMLNKLFLEGGQISSVAVAHDSLSLGGPQAPTLWTHQSPQPDEFIVMSAFPTPLRRCVIHISSNISLEAYGIFTNKLLHNKLASTRSRAYSSIL